MKFFFYLLFLLLCVTSTNAQEALAPQQPPNGPGGKDYIHEEVLQFDFGEEDTGYWLYEPSSPKPEKANVVVFVHGYGALNPMIYGAWIKHLVRKGNIVIFPRYQKNLVSPSPYKFVENTAVAIKNALMELDTGNHVKPIIDHLSLVGHSYGGVIAANLGVNFDSYKLPQPKALMLCSPGTGPFKGGKLKSYADMPEDTRLLILVSNNDRVVGDKVGKLIFDTAENVENRNLLKQYRDKHGSPNLTAGHNESYAVDEEFDNGIRNYSFNRAARKAKTDAMDYFGYWKLFDALLDCSRSEELCEIAFGGTLEQKSLGQWTDGKSIIELEVSLPEKHENLMSEKFEGSH